MQEEGHRFPGEYPRSSSPEVWLAAGGGVGQALFAAGRFRAIIP